VTRKLNLSCPVFLTSLGFLPLDCRASEQKGSSLPLPASCPHLLQPTRVQPSSLMKVLTGRRAPWQAGWAVQIAWQILSLSVSEKLFRMLVLYQILEKAAGRCHWPI